MVVAVTGFVVAATAGFAGLAEVGARSTRLNEFTEHPARLAFAGPPQAAPARVLFDRAYVPLMTAYWRDAKGYGNNRISLAQIETLASLEVYAARAWAIRQFSWPHIASQLETIYAQIAA